MAIQTKTYEFRGHNLQSLIARTDPGVVVDDPAVLYFDVTWDDAVAEEAAIDAALSLYGAMPAAAPMTFSAEALGGGLLAELVALAGDPANARLTWNVIGPDNVVQLFNSNGNVVITAAAGAGGPGRLHATAAEEAILESTGDFARVIGQDVQILSQGAAPGDITIDATNFIRLVSEVVFDLMVVDPGVLEAGMFWFRGDLEVFRYSSDGVAVKTIAPRTYLPECWQQMDVPAAQAATAMPTGVSQLFDTFQVVRAGALAGLNLRLTAAPAAESVTAIVTINGAPTALTVTVAAGATSGRATSDYSIIPIAAGDLVGVTLSSTAGFLPSGSIDVEASVEVWEEP